MSGMIETKRTIGCKIESTPYSEETLAATDFDISAYAISYDPDVQMYARKLARGDFSRDVSIAGKRMISLSFSIDMAWSGTAATAPSYFKCLRACGMKQVIFGSTGVSLQPHADYTNVPLTFQIVERDEGTSPVQVLIKIRGAMGNVKLVTPGVGLPKKMEFEFKGVLVSIEDRPYASLMIPTAFNTALPEAILACTTSLFTEAQKFDKITIDLGNKLEPWTDPSKAEGLEGYHIVDREPTIEIDPALSLIATNGQFARLTGNSTGAYSESIGAHITITAPAAQIIAAYKPGTREGRVTNQIKCLLTRSLGNDELKILQGAEA